MNFRILFFLITVLFISSCVKTDFDQPPIIDTDPHLNANFSIKDLKALHAAGSFETVQEDKIIKAIVVADDRSGNYYRTIVVQDSTGGMEVKINGTGLFADYPVGRRVYIKTKGLTLSDYANNFQVGQGTYIGSNGPTDIRISGILPELASTIIIKGSLRQPVVPKIKKISELTSEDFNTLIQLDSVEFNSSEFGNLFADQDPNSSATSRLVEDCSGKTIELRTSKYADYSIDTVPKGRGNIIAICNVFGTKKQLLLRERTDLSFFGPRCGGNTGGEEVVEISFVRQLFSGTTTTAPANKKIRGIVISDKENSNITAKNIVLFQPGNAGIVVRFIDNNTYSLGDELEVIISNQEISEFNGLLQINNVPNENAKLISTGNSITPQTVTLSQLNSNFESYESTLVKVENVSLSKAGGTYSGSVTMNDGTATFVLYTATAATFANNSFPTSKVSVTGYAMQGGSAKTNEIAIRNLTDVQ